MTKLKSTTGLLAIVVSVLVACDEAKPPQISESDAAMLDAVFFIFTGFEEGQKLAGGIEPIQRVIDRDAIEYSYMDQNPLFESSLGEGSERTGEQVAQKSYSGELSPKLPIQVSALPCAFQRTFQRIR